MSANNNEQICEIKHTISRNCISPFWIDLSRTHYAVDSMLGRNYLINYLEAWLIHAFALMYCTQILISDSEVQKTNFYLRSAQCQCSLFHKSRFILFFSEIKQILVYHQLFKPNRITTCCIQFRVYFFLDRKLNFATNPFIVTFLLKHLFMPKFFLTKFANFARICIGLVAIF